MKSASNFRQNDPSSSSVHRVLCGESLERSGYRIHRPGGTPNWLFVYTTAGAGQFFGETCRPQSLLIVPPDRPHRYGVAGGAASWGQLWAHVVLPSAFDLVARSWVGSREFAIINDAPEEVAEWLRLANVAISDLRRFHAVLGVLVELGSSEDALSSVGQRAMRVIEARYRTQISVEDVARSVGVSQSSLSSHFRREFGMTVRERVESLRLESARRMLVETNAAVEMIALETGFRSSFYFSLRFKKAFGEAPSFYRQQNSQ